MTLKQIHTKLSKQPVAMLRLQITGPSGGKGISKHFKNQMAETSKICIGAKVAIIDSGNFCPMVFGLHSGACGDHASALDLVILGYGC